MKPRWLMLFLLAIVAAPHSALAQSFTPPPTPLCTLTATPPIIEAGDRSRLQWTSKNATSAKIDGIGNITAAQGSLYVTPSKTTDYLAIFYGSGGEKRCLARVVVVPFGSTAPAPTSNSGSGDFYKAMGDGTYVYVYSDGSTRVAQQSEAQASSNGTVTGGTASPGGTISGGTISGGTTQGSTQSDGGTISGGTAAGSTQGDGGTISGGTISGQTQEGPGFFPTGGSQGAPIVNTQSSGATDRGLVPGSCAVNSVQFCDFCALGELLQNIINWMLSISILIAAAMFAWAGMLYFTARGSVGQIERAHKVFASVALGFVLAVGGWLLIQTLINGIASKTFFGGGWSWNTIPACQQARDARQKTINQTVQQWLQTSLPGLSPVQTPSNPGGGGSVSGTPPSGSAAGNVLGPGNADIENGVETLNFLAQDSSTGYCALYVREALAAMGYENFDTNHPEYAYQYGPYLQSNNFTTVSQDQYTAQAGDVVVFQPYAGGSTGGHIQMYNGKEWISDFTQKDFYPGNGYKQSGASYTIYRPG